MIHVLSYFEAFAQQIRKLGFRLIRSEGSGVEQVHVMSINQQEYLRSLD